ncbi:MAG: hypothetical protein WCG00_06815, partial [Hyphomicrobiales bacterium]
MKTLLAGTAALAIAGTTLAYAQQGPGGRGPERGPQARMTASDIAAYGDARIAAVHAGLKLTAEQEKSWPAVEAAGSGLLSVIAAFAMRMAEPHVDAERSSGSPLDLLRNSRYLTALMIFIVPSLAFGVIEVLAPLRLSELGASAELIGLIFFVAGTAEA